MGHGLSSTEAIISRGALAIRVDEDDIIHAILRRRSSRGNLGVGMTGLGTFRASGAAPPSSRAESRRDGLFFPLGPASQTSMYRYVSAEARGRVCSSPALRTDMLLETETAWLSWLPSLWDVRPRGFVKSWLGGTTHRRAWPARSPSRGHGVARPPLSVVSGVAVAMALDDGEGKDWEELRFSWSISSADPLRCARRADRQTRP